MKTAKKASPAQQDKPATSNSTTGMKFQTVQGAARMIGIGGVLKRVNTHDALVEALKLHREFWSKMPKGQLGGISCDIGILNDAFIKTGQALAAAGVK